MIFGSASGFPIPMSPKLSLRLMLSLNSQILKPFISLVLKLTACDCRQTSVVTGCAIDYEYKKRMIRIVSDRDHALHRKFYDHNRKSYKKSSAQLLSDLICLCRRSQRSCLDKIINFIFGDWFPSLRCGCSVVGYHLSLPSLGLGFESRHPHSFLNPSVRSYHTVSVR